MNRSHEEKFYASSINYYILGSLKKYIDFDKNNKTIYINYFFDEFKIVLKVPIVLGGNQDAEIKMDNFNITEYNYLAKID